MLEEKAQKINEGKYPIATLYINLSEMKKCIWCSAKFPDGILRKNPGVAVPLLAHTWFTSEFLVHAQTTHGYSPEMIDVFLADIKKK